MLMECEVDKKLGLKEGGSPCRVARRGLNWRVDGREAEEWETRLVSY